WLRMSTCGPFCLLAQRTIEHSSTRGGLKERGIRTGEYVQAIERSAQNAVRLIRASTRPDAPELIRRARAKVLPVRAIRAVTRHDDKRAAEAFAEAAGRLPE